MKPKTVVLTVTAVTDLPLSALRAVRRVTMWDEEETWVGYVDLSEAPRVTVAQPPKTAPGDAIKPRRGRRAVSTAIVALAAFLCASEAHAQTVNVAPGSQVQVYVEGLYREGWRPLHGGGGMVGYWTSVPGARLSATADRGGSPVTGSGGQLLGVTPGTGYLYGAAAGVLAGNAAADGVLSVSVDLWAHDASGKACNMARTYQLHVGATKGLDFAPTWSPPASTCKPYSAADVPTDFRLVVGTPPRPTPTTGPAVATATPMWVVLATSTPRPTATPSVEPTAAPTRGAACKAWADAIKARDVSLADELADYQAVCR